jgi:hypothetical protein
MQTLEWIFEKKAESEIFQKSLILYDKTCTLIENCVFGHALKAQVKLIVLSKARCSFFELFFKEGVIFRALVFIITISMELNFQVYLLLCMKLPTKISIIGIFIHYNLQVELL